jgi:hypothetical protein
MGKRFYILSAGLVIGLILMHFIQKRQTADEVKPEARSALLMPEKPNLPKAPVKEAVPLTSAEDTEPKFKDLPTEAALTGSGPAEQNLEESKHSMVFDISEDEVEILEQNIPELQDQVTLYRENDGWHVRFKDPSNLLADFGILDNDVIRFSQIEEMKKDPSMERLTGRLEDVLHSLER